MNKYLNLDLHAEAWRDHKFGILSNGNPKMLDALVASSGVVGRFVDLISVDRSKSFKPDLKRAYAMEFRGWFRGILGAEALPQSENHVGQQQQRPAKTFFYT
jgi:hypothetical protein